MKLLIELEAQEDAALVELSKSSLMVVRYIILSYMFPRRFTNRFLLKVLQ